jgi:hypothetical protein
MSLTTNKWFLALLLAAQPALAAAEIYRCQDGGALRFSDRPCGDDAVRLQLPPPNLIKAVPAEPLARQHDERVKTQVRRRAAEDAEWRKRHEQEQRSDEQIRAARIRRELVIGMTANDVRSVRGAPQQIRRDEKGGNPREVWTYAVKDQPRETVTLERGLVVAVGGSKAKSR